jgi:hypothetical protein
MVGGVDQDLDLVAEPGEAFAGYVVGFGVVAGEPARGVDAVEDVVGDVEGEVEAAAVVLDPGAEGEVLGIGDGQELGRPTVGPRNPVASSYSPGEMTPSSFGVAPR